jgi:phosphatidylethanolamine/phosphatidyl-N-methylethanolamine N-methyltransferase
MMLPNLLARPILVACVSIGFSPTFWNTVVQNELRTARRDREQTGKEEGVGQLTRLFGSKYRACYALALAIFTLGLIREALFTQAIDFDTASPDFVPFQLDALHPALCGAAPVALSAAGEASVFAYFGHFGPVLAALFGDASLTKNNAQGSSPVFACDYAAAVAAVLGGIFVAAAYIRLGITGTYLGDYFGILLPARITGFPFSVLEDPMYDGAVMLVVAQAVLARSVVGLVLSLWMWIVYQLAERYENPHTERIYREAAERKKRASPKTH